MDISVLLTSLTSIMLTAFLTYIINKWLKKSDMRREKEKSELEYYFIVAQATVDTLCFIQLNGFAIEFKLKHDARVKELLLERQRKLGMKNE